MRALDSPYNSTVVVVNNRDTRLVLVVGVVWEMYHLPPCEAVFHRGYIPPFFVFCCAGMDVMQWFHLQYCISPTSCVITGLACQPQAELVSMSSRLWEGPSENGFVSSRHISWNQEQGWASGQNRDEQQASSLSQPTEHLSASRRTSSPSSDETNLRLPSHESPLISRAGALPRRPRTPRNGTAVKDGRKFLAAFREKRRNNDAEDSTSVPAAKKRGIDSLDVPPGLAGALAERLEVYQSCAPGLARSLEAALGASSLHRKQLGGDGTEDGEAGGGLKDGKEEVHDDIVIDSVVDSRGHHDVSTGGIDGSSQRSNGTAAQPPLSMTSSSSEGPTPEVSGADACQKRVVLGLLLRTSRSCITRCNSPL